MYARLQGFHRGPGEGVGSDAPPPRTCRGEGQRGPAPPPPIELQIFNKFCGFLGASPRTPVFFKMLYLLNPPLCRKAANAAAPPPPAFEIRPFRLSETTKICGGQSIVNFCEGYFHITLLFKGIYKSSDCQG